MNIINFKVDDKKKKKIEEIVKLRGYKSISEFIREAIDEKINLQKIIDDFKQENPPLDKTKIKIPDFIPEGKYLGIARNEIVIVGDSIKEVVEKLYNKFPEAATGIIRKGKDIESFETLYSFFSAENTKCYHQAEINNIFYPLLEIVMEINGNMKPLLGLIDTGASIMAIDKIIINRFDLKPIRKSMILTANGIIETPIYKCNFKYENRIYKLEFISSELGGPLGIQALIGKNFIDKFNLILLGKERLFCLQQLISL